MLNQFVIPAARTIKDFEHLMKSHYEYVIMLDVHIAKLPHLRNLAKEHGKKLLVHADLVQGLKNDEAGAQFLCQVIRPAGLISTHSNVVSTARKHGLLSIQRIFLLDSHSLETSYRVMNSSNPDFVEVLPGMMPQLIREVCARTHRPVFAGGFIRTIDDVRMILESGAAAITTSSRDIWEQGMSVREMMQTRLRSSETKRVVDVDRA